MRSLWNFLGDPSLHLLGIALLIVLVTFGRGFRPEELSADSPLPTCQACRSHYLPGASCACPGLPRLAQAAR